MPISAEEHLIPVTRTGRFFTLGTAGPHVRQLWYVLHGYGQLGSYFIKHFEGIADPETLIVAPEGLSLFYIPPGWVRVGATWMTKEKRLSEISDYVAYLDGIHDQISPSLPDDCVINVLGFSQGATTAWRWARLGKVRPQHFVNWAGSVPDDGQTQMDAWADKVQHYFVQASQDEYISNADAEKQIAAFRQRYPNLKNYLFEGNHRMDEDTLKAVFTDILRQG